MVRVRRSFENDFKKQVVESILSGSATQAELAREHRISPVMISRWQKDYKKGKFFENVTSRDMARLELRISDLERLVGRLTLENEMLKKLRTLIPRKKRVFIHSNLKRLGPAGRGCQIVGLSRSTYYYKPKKNPPDMELAERIEAIALDFPSYGYRRITAELHRQGLKVNHKRVLRLMRDKNLLCRARRAFKATTDSSHGIKKYPNLIDDLILYRTDQLWHADITYIRIVNSFVYLAAIIDGFSRKIIGYGLGRTLSAELALAALKDAISKRNTSDLIHCYDQGIQYCSSEYIEILIEHNIAISMSGKANSYDNARIESFFRTLKVEEIYMFEYETYTEFLKRIPYFIEEVYNRKRLHSSLGYMPPRNLKI